MDEVFTWAEGAQFPLPDAPEHLPWQDLNASIRSVHRANQHLIAWNRGKDGLGFSVCASCGATEPGLRDPTEPHKVPYMARGRQDCAAPDFRPRMGLFYRFPTDLLALQIRWAEPMFFDLDQPWWEDALITLAEALRLASAHHLDIDPDELRSGYRLTQEEPAKSSVAEFFLYDTAAGGAGYAEKVGLDLRTALMATLELLEGCKNPECATSCRDCLETPGNRGLHIHFERKLAGRLLRFALTGEVPGFFPEEEIQALLLPLKKWLQLERKSSAREVFPLLRLEPGATGWSASTAYSLSKPAQVRKTVILEPWIPNEASKSPTSGIGTMHSVGLRADGRKFRFGSTLGIQALLSRSSTMPGLSAPPSTGIYSPTCPGLNSDMSLTIFTKSLPPKRSH